MLFRSQRPGRRGGDVRTVVERCLVRQRGERDVAHHLALPPQHHAPGIGDMADDREVQLPLAEDCFGKIIVAF